MAHVTVNRLTVALSLAFLRWEKDVSLNQVNQGGTVHTRGRTTDALHTAASRHIIPLSPETEDYRQRA
jgi:hypothetical protein